MKNFAVSLILPILFVSVVNLNAQMAHVRMIGEVSAETGDALLNPEELPIEVWSDGNLLNTVFPDNNGHYEITMNFGRNYRIRFGSNPWAVKMVDVNLKTTVFPAGDICYTLQHGLSLFRRPAGSDFDFLDEMPVAIANFDSEANCMTWDISYSESLTHSILSTLRNSQLLKPLP